ncbi:hypothetical protein MTO96_050321 [Rhipicephalus appendiculatus]
MATVLLEEWFGNGVWGGLGAYGYGYPVVGPTWGPLALVQHCRSWYNQETSPSVHSLREPNNNLRFHG